MDESRQEARAREEPDAEPRGRGELTHVPGV